MEIYTKQKDCQNFGPTTCWYFAYIYIWKISFIIVDFTSFQFAWWQIKLLWILFLLLANIFLFPIPDVNLGCKCKFCYNLLNYNQKCKKTDLAFNLFAKFFVHLIALLIWITVKIRWRCQYSKNSFIFLRWFCSKLNQLF